MTVLWDELTLGLLDTRVELTENWIVRRLSVGLCSGEPYDPNNYQQPPKKAVSTTDTKV